MRPPPATRAFLLLTALTLAGPASGATATDVVLAPRAAVTDPRPDGRFNGAAVVTRLREELAASPAFSLVSLGPDRLLSLDDRAVLLVPVITNARTSKEIRADSILEVVAHVGGALWVVDPWTNAALYATTRLVSAPVQVAVDAHGLEDQLVREAFSRALDRWTTDGLSQLRENVSPFVVDGFSGTIPRGATKTGGIWLRGRVDGVRPGMIVRSEDGSLARVETAAERFSSLRDLSDAGGRIPAGRRYRAIAVRDAASRPEPIVVVHWLGRPLDSEGDSNGSLALSSTSVVDLVQSYLASGGGLRVVPASSGGLSGSAEFRELSDLVSRHASLGTSATGMTWHRETSVRLAENEPDIVCEVGVLGTYHGTRQRPDSGTEHLYRVSLLGVAGTPLPDGGWALAKTVEGTEERAVVEMEGVRKVEAPDAWFTATRNASILLAERLRAAALEIGGGPAAARTREGRVGPKGELAWADGLPGRHTPLAWLRPGGDVTGADGQTSLGVLLERMEPSKGFLNLVNLPGERLRPGDVLSYRATGTSTPPPVRLSVRLTGQNADLFQDPDVFGRQVAGRLAATGVVSPSLGEPSGAAGSAPLFEVVVGVPTVEETVASTSISAEWRGRLWASDPAGQGEPLLKTGVAYSEERRYEADRPLLAPRDRGGELASFSSNAMERLVEMVMERGFARAVGAESSTAIERRSEP